MAVNKIKILVIDDEKDLCSLFKTILTPEGYTVLTARNGYDGIKINEKSDPDIILLDLKMPGINGIGTLRRIRKKDLGVIVIIITGYGDARTIREAGELNVYEYMAKPFNNETVIKIIKEAVASNSCGYLRVKMANIRSLIYVPVLHTRKETGEILLSLKGDEAEGPADTSLIDQEKSVKEMWEGIYEKIQKTNIPYLSIRIYQDALPVCGREKEIVGKLAQKASRNHQLILELLKNGANLEGTEDPDLLIQEYDYLNQLISKASVSTQGGGYKNSFNEYKDKSMKLMKQRDAFITERIKSTLKTDEVPLVFMGVRHELEKLLQGSFVINYIIYRLPFKKVRDIYNV